MSDRMYTSKPLNPTSVTDDSSFAESSHHRSEKTHSAQLSVQRRNQSLHSLQTQLQRTDQLGHHLRDISPNANVVQRQPARATNGWYLRQPDLVDQDTATAETVDRQEYFTAPEPAFPVQQSDRPVQFFLGAIIRRAARGFIRMWFPGR